MSEQQNGAASQGNEKVMAILAYIIFFVPMITGDWKKSQFVRYHTNQGLVLFLVGVVGSVACTILTLVTFGLLWFLTSLWPLAYLVFVILGAVNASSLQTKPLPLIGGINLLK